MQENMKWIREGGGVGYSVVANNRIENSSSKFWATNSIAHRLSPNSLIPSHPQGLSCPITSASGLSTYSATRVSPRTGIRAFTFRSRIFRTRSWDREKVSGMSVGLVDLVQVQRRWRRVGDVHCWREVGRRSIMWSRRRE